MVDKSCGPSGEPFPCQNFSSGIVVLKGWSQNVVVIPKPGEKNKDPIRKRKKNPPKQNHISSKAVSKCNPHLISGARSGV